MVTAVPGKELFGGNSDCRDIAPGDTIYSNSYDAGRRCSVRAMPGDECRGEMIRPGGDGHGRRSARSAR